MRTRGKFYGENTPKRKRKRNCDPCSFSSSSVCSSKVSICSSKMSSKLPELHDEELLLYLEYLSMDDKQFRESHSYNWWESVSQNLAKKVGNSLDTNACILASRGHETMYSKYFERNPRLLKHPTLGSSNYLRALHNIYRKTRENVLRHPSTTGGPIRSGRSHGSGSRSHGITPYSSGQSSRSHGITPYSSWSVLEPKVTVACGILYKKKLVTEKEMDDIAEHFKNSPTEVGANVFLDLSVEDQAVYVKNRLAEKQP